MIKFIIPFVIAFAIMGAFIIFDNKDTCLDIGICKAGLTLKIDGQNITVNKNTCSEYKGVWQDKTNACWFKN